MLGVGSAMAVCSENVVACSGGIGLIHGMAEQKYGFCIGADE